MIIVLARVCVQAEHVEHALALSREHVQRSRAEPGCLAHAVHRDVEDPLRLVFVEQWLDQAALAAHFKLAASRSFARTLASLASQAPTMALYEASLAAP